MTVFVRDAADYCSKYTRLSTVTAHPHPRPGRSLPLTAVRYTISGSGIAAASGVSFSDVLSVLFRVR